MGEPGPLVEAEWNDGEMGEIGGVGTEEGGWGNAEKLMVLSAIPEAFVSREGLEAW